MAIVQQERFSGPIAHPKHLREYENILPGAADRIISMAEHNLKHNQDFQMGALNADIKDSGDGRKYGFAALCLLILGAIFSTWLDNTALALAFLGTGALGVIGLFIRGRKETEDS